MQPYVGRHVCPPFTGGLDTANRHSTEHGLAGKLKVIPAGKCGFSACGRGPRAREKAQESPQTVERRAGSLNGQKIKDTRAPLTGFQDL